VTEAPTVGALIARATRRLARARLHYGHGTARARDEAAYLVLHALGLPLAPSAADLARAVTPAQAARAAALVGERIARRVPAAYLTQRTCFAGLEFHVDPRVLVPRSPLAELIEARFEPWLDSRRVRRVLDIGTGSGCIAIATALTLPWARVDATDISSDALAVAAINRARHGLEGRLTLLEADLFPPHAPRYDLILSNPPYVPDTRLSELPPEYAAEPALGLCGGADGLDCVARILRHAAAHLSVNGVLIVEVGESADAVASRYPELPFTWLEFERGGEGVFLLERAHL